jgi:hypothetical protein
VFRCNRPIDPACSSLSYCLVKVANPEVLESLFQGSCGADIKQVVTADLELELEYVYYSDSVASITMQGPAHVATWKLLSARLQKHA